MPSLYLCPFQNIIRFIKWNIIFQFFFYLKIFVFNIKQNCTLFILRVKLVPPQQLRVIQRGNQWPPNRASIGTSTSTSSSSSTSAHWVNKQLDTNNNGLGSDWSQHQHVVYSTPKSSLSILHNVSMINEIATAHQPEETELTLFCDSIGGSFFTIFYAYSTH